MASSKELHSTEKLLKVIRNDSKAAGTLVEDISPIPSGSTGTMIRLSAFKKITIGVDIGHTYLKLAKVARISDKKHELLDYLTVRPAWPFSIDDPKFLELLKSTLGQFCGNGSHCSIWSAIPSAKVETRCLRIPKLPRKQVANAVFWTFTKTVEFNEADEWLDYEILGDINEQGIKKTEVLTYKAPKKEAADLKAVFESIGFPLSGISIAPFAIQNLLRTRIIEQEQKDICSLFVGRDWSRIAIFSNGNLVLSRGIKAGMQSMVDSIDQALTEGPYRQDSDSGGTTGFPAPDPQQILLDFISPSGSSRTLPGSEPSQVFLMLKPAVERLIRQVERTFEHFAGTLHREGVRRLLLSGPICANSMVMQYIGRQLDLPVEVLNPFGPGTEFAQKIKMPASPEERESYVPAIGLALAHKSLTPNILFTHRQKERMEAVQRINMRILTGCIICLIALIAVFLWQERRLDAKRSAVQQLNEQLSVYQPAVEKDMIMAMYAKVIDKQSIFSQTTQRYLPVAVINELAQITPVSVRIMSIDAIFETGAPAAAKISDNTIKIEGLVFEPGQNFEAALTAYMLDLKNSPLFSKPAIQSRQIEYYNEQRVLRFKASVEIL